MNKATIQKRLTFWTNTLDELYKAYAALVKGGVKSYRINDRDLTKFDLGSLQGQIKQAESMVDELTALLENQRPRKAFGVLPRDW